MKRTRSAMLLAVASTLAVTACSVSSDEGTSSTAATTAASTAPETTASNGGPTSAPETTAAPSSAPGTTIPVRGVTADSIKLGIAPIDVEALKSKFGVDLGNMPPGVIEALAEAVNAAGGINGRKVELVIRPFMPVGTEDAEAACRELIEDKQVYAVVSFFLGDGGLCVTETYKTPYFSQFGLTEERKERSVAPFISLEGDALGASVQKLIDTGVLDGKKLAIYHESDVSPEVIANEIKPALEKAGITVVGTAQRPSSGDAVQAANDIDVIFQRFEADGANALLAISGAAVLLPALERTSWAPQLVFTNGQFTSDGGLDNLGLTDFSELDGSLAVTMSLLSDDVAVDPLFKECVATINKYAGTDITTDDIYSPDQKPNSREYGQLPALCMVWDMTTTVLERVGNDLSPEPMRAALDKVGKFALPGYPNAEITSERWGAVDTVRLWRYNSAEKRFVPQAD